MTFVVRGRNEAFTCERCAAAVPAHPSSVRNHCPSCLWSKHVDVAPGDREAVCGGMMEPVGVEGLRGKWRVVQRCIACGEERPCVAAPDDDIERLVAAARSRAEGSAQ